MNRQFFDSVKNYGDTIPHRPTARVRRLAFMGRLDRRHGVAGDDRLDAETDIGYFTHIGAE